MKTPAISLRLGLIPAALVVLVVAAAHPAGGASGDGVAGSGSGVLVLPPFTGDRVTIVLEPPGRFEVTHFDKMGQEFARLAGTITCLEVRGSTAFLTGTIDRGHAPDVVGDPRGQILPITIADHGPTDLAGLAPPSPLAPPCSPVPPNTVIDQGGFTVSSSLSPPAYRLCAPRSAWRRMEPVPVTGGRRPWSTGCRTRATTTPSE